MDFEPIEKTDPLIADLFMDVANKLYDKYNVKAIILANNNVRLIPYKNYDVVGPYEKCPCGSGLKRKFCKCMILFES